MHASLPPWIRVPSLTILKKQWAPSAAVVRTDTEETTSSSSEAVAASSTTGAAGTTTEKTETSKFKWSMILETKVEDAGKIKLRRHQFVFFSKKKLHGVRILTDLLACSLIVGSKILLVIKMGCYVKQFL